MNVLILDRDGVINQDSDQFIKSAAEWQPITNSLQAIADLSTHCHIVVATNQSGLARGLFNKIDLDQMHQKMKTLIKEKGGRIDGIYYCPHAPDAHCDCRKPKAGLMYQILDQYPNHQAIDVFVVGDSLRDLEAAQVAKMQPVLVKTGKGQKTLKQIAATDLADVPVFENLYSFSQTYIKNLCA